MGNDIDIQKFEILLSHIGSINDAVNFNSKLKAIILNIGDNII